MPNSIALDQVFLTGLRVEKGQLHQGMNESVHDVSIPPIL